MELRKFYCYCSEVTEVWNGHPCIKWVVKATTGTYCCQTHFQGPWIVICARRFLWYGQFNNPRLTWRSFSNYHLSWHDKSKHRMDILYDYVIWSRKSWKTLVLYHHNDLKKYVRSLPVYSITVEYSHGYAKRKKKSALLFPCSWS
jgi:hypothetical protein